MTSKAGRYRFAYAVLAAALAAALLSGVLQHLVVSAFGGVDGSFGIRPATHRCLGLTVPADYFGWLPACIMEVRWPLYLRYQVGGGRGGGYCIGQDVWYGE